MDRFIIADKNGIADFVHDADAYSGVVKIANKVIEDLYKVSGQKAENKCLTVANANSVIYGTVGHSAIIKDLAERGKIDLAEITGKREVYGFFLVEKPYENVEWSLVIAGSDKRGTIYGLFHLSEILGVSPFVNWSNVIPAKREVVELTQADNYISKEPSVEYRGFFINDEWPAFGTWCSKHFGGFTAKMYDGVFELLLRLKGNYMWPAMWSSCFAEEGPGLASAELADEYGVVMGLSHHEPCLRHGEEYSHVRGKDSIYGDAWNFQTNPEGIRRFWRDGLKRNGHLENIITIGMRGERDSAIMGDEATLEDNINLLRDVIRNQHQLIREEVNSDLEKVPRLLALYKEVEPYFYGDANTKGLIEDEELKDVIFLLCDDNHGYLRSIPQGKMAEHKGGYGMYYHFDYHGDPVSYEWVNSSYLPCVWEQMTRAYESGIRKLWIVNVGDLALQEFPLNYFMDLAYDYDRYGINHPNETVEYTLDWAKKNFGHSFDEQTISLMAQVITEYSHINHNRRPEHLNERVYAVNKHKEALVMLNRAKSVIEKCEHIKGACGEEQLPAFYELIYYNAVASMNLLCMWIYRSFNHYAASKAALVANAFGDKMTECLHRDAELKKEFQSLLDGRWDGFAEARHIGFENWNSEESHNPVCETVWPVDDSRIVVGVSDSDITTTGEDWTKKRLVINEPQNAAIYLATASSMPIDYEVSCDADWIKLSTTKGVLDANNSLAIIDITCDAAVGNKDAIIRLKYQGGNAEILVKANNNPVVCLEAEHYSRKNENAGGNFVVLKDLARNCSAVKTLPINTNWTVEDNLWLEYDLPVKEAGEYVLTLELEPANPARFGEGIELSYAWNDGDVRTMSVLDEGYTPGVTLQWKHEVMNHVRRVNCNVVCKAGVNKLRVYATSSENVLEKVILTHKDVPVDVSYLGPQESL